MHNTDTGFIVLGELCFGGLRIYLNNFTPDILGGLTFFLEYQFCFVLIHLSLI